MLVLTGLYAQNETRREGRVSMLVGTCFYAPHASIETIICLYSPVYMLKTKQGQSAYSPNLYMIAHPIYMLTREEAWV